MSVTIEGAGLLEPHPFWIQSGDEASTHFTSVDGCNLRSEAEARGAQALSVRADAGAPLSMQSGLRGLRKDPVSGAHFENGIDAGRVLQGRGGVRNADGFDPRRRTADAFANR